MAGIVNPEPSITDTLFTITRLRSTAQSVFYASPDYLDANAGYPRPIRGATFGVDSNYHAPEVKPATQAGGAQVLLEFQGAQAVDNDRTTIPPGAELTPWTANIDDCDGFAFIRWRATLIGNLTSGEVPRVDELRIPLTDDN